MATDRVRVDLVVSVRDAARAMERFNRGLRMFVRVDALNRRANRFTTPWWQRPYWRFRGRLVRWGFRLGLLS